jgi:1-acyl-sn-glycerol-3-phosphate acyltransferase
VIRSETIDRPTEREPEPDRVPSRTWEEPSAIDVAISAGMWAAGLSFLAPSMGAMTAIYSLVPSHRVNVLGRLYCKGQIALTFSKWRAVVDPAVNPDRAYIFAQNHTNHFDHVMLYNATPHFKQGLELESHFKYPFYGWFMKARGTIPVKKGERGQTSNVFLRMKREIDEGRSILAFPEGTRSRSGRVERFKSGVFFIARDLGVPIVPVSVTGSFELMRAGSLMLRPGADITVYCDKPVETAGRDPEEVMNEVREVISARVDSYWKSKT